MFAGKHCKNTVKNNVLEGYIWLSWLAAVEHGKVEEHTEHTVNSGIFEGLERQTNWKHGQT